MGDYNSHVVSVRVDADLLEAVRRRARADGRSVSGEIVFIVREQLEAEPLVKRKPKPISGWLSEIASPESFAEFRAGRADASQQLLRAVRKKARRS